MSVESEILRIQHNIANAYATVAEKGGEVPLQATSSNLAAAVASIQTGVTQEELNEALTATQPKLTGQPGQVVGFAADGTAVAVPGWSNPNLLLNWDFRNPVNRNGKAEYTTSTVSIYTLDRWVLSGSSSANAKLEVVDGGVRITSANAFRQTAEDSVTKSLVGKIVTVSALMDVEVPPQSGQIGIVANNAWIGSTPLPKTAGTDILVSATISVGNVSKLDPWIYSAAGGIYKLKAMKLELGAQQTLAHQDADGNWEIIDPPDYDLQYALCSLYSPSTRKWVGYQHSNPNLLDNWYFADPVNQRGQTEYTGAEYAIDRWKLSNGSLTLSTAGATALLINTDSAQSRNVLFQLIERCSNFVGKTLTFSVLVTDLNGKMTASVYENGSKSIYNGNGILSDGLSTVTFTIPATAAPTEFRVHFLLSASGSCRPIAAKLELGAQQTLAHQDADGNWVLNDPPPNKALELAKCQRYQIVYDSHSSAYAGILANGIISAIQNSTRVFISLPTFVRIKNPTVSMVGAPWYITSEDSKEYEITDISFAQSVGNCVRFGCNVNPLPSANVPIRHLQTHTTENAKLIVDYNL